MSLWEKIKAFFNTTKGPTIVEQFKEIIEEEKTIAKNVEAVVEASINKVEEIIKTEVKAVETSIHKAEEAVKVEVKAVNDQITDAVTQAKAIVKKPRKKK